MASDSPTDAVSCEAKSPEWTAAARKWSGRGPADEGYCAFIRSNLDRAAAHCSKYGRKLSLKAVCARALIERTLEDYAAGHGVNAFWTSGLTTPKTEEHASAVLHDLIWHTWGCRGAAFRLRDSDDPADRLIAGCAWYAAHLMFEPDQRPPVNAVRTPASPAADTSPDA